MGIRTAATLILLHGNTAHAWWWKPIAASVLDGGKFRLIALDQRGHGDSDLGAAASLSGRLRQ